jgi:uncharacterized protein YjbJ (UPF0337 family)
MNKEEVRGGAEKLGGKIKEQFGKVTGNPVTEQKGREEQVKGQLRETAGKVKDAVEHPSKH